MLVGHAWTNHNDNEMKKWLLELIERWIPEWRTARGWLILLFYTVSKIKGELTLYNYCTTTDKFTFVDFTSFLCIIKLTVLILEIIIDIVQKFCVLGQRDAQFIKSQFHSRGLWSSTGIWNLAARLFRTCYSEEVIQMISEDKKVF